MTTRPGSAAARTPADRATVDVWYAPTSDVTADRALEEAIDRLLAVAERERCRAFALDRHRHEYLATRALERVVLGSCLRRRPAELSFRRTEHGRPELDPSMALRFSLTNTSGIVACGVALEREIGIDAEPLARGDQVLGVAGVVFTAGERAMLDALPLEPRRRRAVELWTSKEAYVKARGLGMALPVERIEVVWDGGAPSLRFREGIDDDSARWLLATWQVADHLLAACVERRGDERSAAIALERADLGVLLDPGSVSGTRPGGPAGS